MSEKIENLRKKISLLEKPGKGRAIQQFTIKIPSSKRTITVETYYGSVSKYFLLFPEMVFNFTIQKNTTNNMHSTLTMKTFYFHSGNAYKCMLPNLDHHSRVCFNNEAHYEKIVDLSNGNIKNIVAESINDFFSSAFHIEDFRMYNYQDLYSTKMLYHSVKRQKIISYFKNSYGVCDVLHDVDYDFFVNQYNSGFNFFEFWQSESNNVDFKIFDCSKIKTSPMNKEWLKHYEISSSIDFKDFMKL
jgi:hypothetical protein